MTFTLIASWIACGIVAAGIFFNHFQRSYPEQAWPSRRTDLGAGILFGVFGPFSMVTAFFLSGFKLPDFTGISEEESWAAFHRRHPHLPREYWLR